VTVDIGGREDVVPELRPEAILDVSRQQRVRSLG
jgi:hypothetical protein